MITFLSTPMTQTSGFQPVVAHGYAIQEEKNCLDTGFHKRGGVLAKMHLPEATQQKRLKTTDFSDIDIITSILLNTRQEHSILFNTITRHY